MGLAESFLFKLVVGIFPTIASGIGTSSDGDTHVIILATNLCILNGVDGRLSESALDFALVCRAHIIKGVLICS